MKRNQGCRCSSLIAWLHSIRPWAGDLGMVEHTCNLSIWRLRQENSEFEVSIGYMVGLRPVWIIQQGLVKQTNNNNKSRRQWWKQNQEKARLEERTIKIVSRNNNNNNNNSKKNEKIKKKKRLQNLLNINRQTNRRRKIEGNSKPRKQEKTTSKI